MYACMHACCMHVCPSVEVLYSTLGTLLYAQLGTRFHGLVIGQARPGQRESGVGEGNGEGYSTVLYSTLHT